MALAGSLGNNAGLAVGLTYLITVIAMVVWTLLAIFSQVSNDVTIITLILILLSVAFLVLGYIAKEHEP